MLKINLLPSDGARRVTSTSSAASMLLIGVVGSLVLLLGGLFLFHATKKAQVEELRSHNAQLQGAVDAIKTRVSDHQKILDELADIHRREDAIEHLQAARTGPTSMLVEISRILSPGGHPTADPVQVEWLRQHGRRDEIWSPTWDSHRLWLVSFDEDNRNVKIAGEGRTPDDVGELMRRMLLSQYFQNVRLDRTEASVNPDTKLAVQRFSITARVRY